MNFGAHVAQRGWENCNITINIQGPQGICKTEVKNKFLYLPSLAGIRSGDRIFFPITFI
jgi:hypothetical protein